MASSTSGGPTPNPSPELWRRLEPLLDRALDQPEEDRLEWIQAATVDAEDLRPLLLQWVAECSDADGFLDSVAPKTHQAPDLDHAPDLDEVPDRRLATRLGPHRLVEVLGRGGMGVVYLGRRDDDLFDQEVAVKIADRRLEPEALERFRWERRILAELEHPSIARLFDGGVTEDGAPYLVMERIDGEPIDQHCRQTRASKRRRIELMIDVCRALDHAHRRRVVHLDLKPSNILVTAAGAVKLVDFGIGQLLGEDGGSTRSIAERLTPAFAAPEQWRREAVTSSADLYSLGVVLYLLMTDHLPTTDRSPPASGDPELDAILARLITEHPEERYDSAARVAAELARWRDDRPVEAMAGGPVYLLRKHLRRHTRAWALAAAAVLAASVFLFNWWQERRDARRQLEATAEFSRLAEKGESFLRYVYALPPHDVRREQELARERLREIEDRMKNMDETLRGPGHYALGRGWASLHQHRQAVVHLEEAWRSGLQRPEVAYALGRSLGELYAQQRNLSRSVADAEIREQMLATADRQYRRRAIELLDTVDRPAEDISPHLLDGLIAFHDGRMSDALSSAEQATAETPWLSDGLVLATRAHIYLSKELADSGDYSGAHGSLELAGRELTQARALAPSNPELGVLACSLELHRLDVARQQGGMAAALSDRANERCWQALELDPELIEPRQMLATFEILRGQSPRSPLVERRIAIDRAFELMDQAPVNADEDAGLARTRATALLARALLALASGEDAITDLEAAITLFRRSIELDATQILARMNLATTLALYAQVAQAGSSDPDSLFEQAIAGFDQALDRLPGSALLLYNLASLHYARGIWLESADQPSLAAFAAALETVDQVIERNDRLPHALNLRGAVLERLANGELDAGDSHPALRQRLEKGLASLDLALEIDPNYPAAWVTRGALLLTTAHSLQTSAADESPYAKVQLALESFARAEELLGRRTEVMLRNLARAHLLAAELQCDDGDDGDDGVDAGSHRIVLEELLDQAGARFPSSRAWAPLTARFEKLQDCWDPAHDATGLAP